MMMMMSNGGGGGGGGGGAGDGNVNGRGRKRDHQQVEEDDHESAMKNYPTGYRFRPTDEELIRYYLYRKVNKLRLPPNLIKEVNIYAFHPSYLSDTYRSYEDNVFYFFTPRERKYSNGCRPSRAANEGYWKASGTDNPVMDTKTNTPIGYKRGLVFYRGKPPKTGSKNAPTLKETKTDWHMHEYTLKKLKDEENDKRPFTDDGSSDHKQLDEFVLCKLYIKSHKSAKAICKDKAVNAIRPPSIANATSSAVVPAVVPEDHHQMHQAVDAAAVVGDHQYPLTSRVAMASAEKIVSGYQHYMCQTGDVVVGNHQYPLTSRVVMASAEKIVPGYQHYMCKTDDVVVGNHQYRLSSRVATAGAEVMEPECQYYMCQSNDVADGNHHQYSLTSMVLEAAGEMKMMPFNYNCNYLDNGNPSFSSAQPLEILPSGNHHTYGQMNQQQQLQLAILPSVNHHYSGEMNQQQQLQPTGLPSMNHQQLKPTGLPSMGLPSMNHQQLQPTGLPSMNHQQQLQSTGLPSVNQHDQMNQQQLQPAVLPSVNHHHTNGQIMNQQQLQEEYDWETFVADLKEIGFQPNLSFFSQPEVRTNIGPR